jgi:3-hydroxyisobutyrate dehydrogenase-like beta-hydroxyacid dehydrogenase
MSNPHFTIGFIGLGNMGGAMVRHLIAAGHSLRVHARRADAMAPFVSIGAVACETPRDAAFGADIVMTNVTSTDDVVSVLLGPNGVIESARSGVIICDFSTIDAKRTRAIASELSARDIEFLDCPVSGGVKAATAGTLSIMVGGKVDVLARVRSVLEKLGSNIFHMGDVGAGQITKACNQIVQVVNIQGIAEAMRFANTHGVDAQKVVDALMAGFAGSKMLGLMGPKMASRDFAAGIEARLHHKDFGLIASAAKQDGVELPAVDLVYAQLERLMQHGWGTMDTCNLLRVLEQESPNRDQ